MIKAIQFFTVLWTFILAILNVVGILNISWWVVFTPVIMWLIFLLLIFIGCVIAAMNK